MALPLSSDISCEKNSFLLCFDSGRKHYYNFITDPPNLKIGGSHEKICLKSGEKGIDALHVQELTARPLAPREVCVRMHAASLNYRDLIAVNMGVSHELIPLSDGAGVVEDVGGEVVHLKIGDRVLGLFFPLWQSGNIDAGKFAVARGGVPTDGMLAHYVYGLEDSFVKFPDYLTYEELRHCRVPV